jgi:hypothetical protein
MIRFVTEPDLLLPDLPRGVCEITITRPGRAPFVVHSRKPPSALMDVAARYFSDGKWLGGPAPVKVKGKE